MKLTPGIEKAIAGFYNLFTVGEAQPAKTVDLAFTIGVRPSDISTARRMLVEQGSMEFVEDRDPRRGIHVATWKLLDTAEVTAQKIGSDPTPSVSHWRADHGERSLYERGVLKPWKKNLVDVVYISEDPKPEPVVVEIETKPVTLTRSLPDLAPLRKSEPKALVEATRQYLHRWDVAHKAAVGLVEAGLAADTKSVLDVLKLDHREDFDTVALVLPYIDELERRITNLDKLQESLRSKAARADDLEVQLRRTKEQNTRLIASKAEITMNGARD